MKRLTIVLVLLFLCLGIMAGIYYLWSGSWSEPPSITPIAYTPEFVPPPIPVPTAEPGIRVIPLPPRIITVEIIREFIPVNNPATLEIVNDWTSPITVNFQGVEITIAPGESETNEIPPGEYLYTMIADCGQETQSITLEANTAYTLHLYCTIAGVSGQLPGADWATLEVNNQTGEVITLSINGHSYQVPPGLMEIQLPPGSYTYSAILPSVGTTNPESVILGAGMRQPVTFFISEQ